MTEPRLIAHAREPLLFFPVWLPPTPESTGEGYARSPVSPRKMRACCWLCMLCTYIRSWQRAAAVIWEGGHYCACSSRVARFLGTSHRACPYGRRERDATTTRRDDHPTFRHRIEGLEAAHGVGSSGIVALCIRNPLRIPGFVVRAAPRPPQLLFVSEGRNTYVRVRVRSGLC
jgi:hypothetical protein